MKIKLFLLILLFLLSGCGNKSTSANEENTSQEPTPEITIIPTPTIEPTAAPTPTIEPTATPTPTIEPTATPTPTIEPTATPTPTIEPTATPTPTIEPTATPTPTIEPTATPTPTIEPTATPTPTIKPTATPTPEVSLKDKYIKDGVIVVNIKRDRDAFIPNFSNRDAYGELWNLKEYIKVIPNSTHPILTFTADEYYIGIVEFDSDMTEEEFDGVQSSLFHNVSDLLHDMYPEYSDSQKYNWEVFSARCTVYEDVIACKDKIQVKVGADVRIHEGRTSLGPVIKEFLIYYTYDFVYTSDEN